VTTNLSFAWGVLPPALTCAEDQANLHLADVGVTSRRTSVLAGRVGLTTLRVGAVGPR